MVPVLRENACIPKRLEALQHLDFRNPRNGPWEKLLQEILMTKAERKDAADRKDIWNRLRPIIDGATSTQYQNAISQLLDVVRESVPSAQPVIRLWGNRGRLNSSNREEFSKIGRQIGQCCAMAGFALSCSMLNSNTLEYYALMGVREAKVDHLREVSIYFHFNGAESPYAPGDAEKLFRELPPIVRKVEVKYPQHDTFYLNNINENIAYEKSTTHDARMGSLLQCDCVLLVGGTHSAKHLLQILTYLRQQRMKASKPVIFIPVPWVGGIARKVFQAYDGVVEEIDFALLG